MGMLRDLFSKYREIIMYAIMGVATTFVCWGSYFLFTDLLHFELNVSNILSWLVAVIFAFVVNKWYVFEAKSLDLKTVTKELVAFIGSRIFTGVIAWILFPILIFFGIDKFIFDTPGFLAKVITSIVEIVLNWVLSKYVVFREKKTDKKE
jgi:putative flippase GtrA